MSPGRESADRMPSPLRRYFTTPHPAVVATRLFLAAVFLLYGTIKLTGGQFVYDWQQQTFTRGSEHGHTIIWYFFGYSRAYGTFIGLCEIVPALLLLSHRTARLATLVLFAVSGNVALMDVCYGMPLPATLSVGFYALLCGALLWRDRRELARGLFPA
jgi:uncharacterized membrane protein YphA (DoxX/SURF4 family)